MCFHICVCECNTGARDGFGDSWLCEDRCCEAASPACSFSISLKTVSSCCSLGADLLKLTKEDLVQICGAADGIRLYNSLKSR